MINFIGRLFVVLTFAFSLMFLALSIGVYANHVPWKNNNKDNPGVIDRYEAKIKELGYSRDRSAERYAAAYNTLGQVEAERARRQFFYTAKFNMLKTGKDDKGQVQETPVYGLEFDKPAIPGQAAMVVVRMVPQDQNLILQVRGEALRSQEAFAVVLAARHKDILAEQQTIAQLQTQLEQLTNQMQGPTGLLRQKDIMVDARNRAVSQQEFLKPSLANRFAEATLWLEREQNMRRRLDLLTKGGGRAAAGD